MKFLPVKALLAQSLLISLVSIVGIAQSQEQSTRVSPNKTPLWQEHQAVSKKAERGSSADQGATPKAPISVNTIAPDHRDKKTNNHESRNPNTPTESWSLSDKIAAGALIAGLLQFIALVITICVMRRTARTDLRAYIAPERGYIYILNDRLRAEIDIRNTGKTFGKEAQVNLDFKPTKIRAPKMAFDSALIRSSGTDGKTVLMPNAVWRFYREFPLYLTDLDEIRDERNTLEITGRIDYIDVFGKSRWTTFHFINGRLGREGWDVLATEQGNDAN